MGAKTDGGSVRSAIGMATTITAANEATAISQGLRRTTGRGSQKGPGHANPLVDLGP